MSISLFPVTDRDGRQGFSVRKDGTEVGRVRPTKKGTSWVWDRMRGKSIIRTGTATTRQAAVSSILTAMGMRDPSVRNAVLNGLVFEVRSL